MKMNRIAVLFGLTVAACSCSHDPAGVRISHDAPAAAPVAAAPVSARSEPVFYNGKTYHVSFTPDAAGAVAVAIAGMSGAQAKDALALSHSTFHHFNCKDSQKAVLQSAPVFDGNVWRSAGRCV